MTSKIQPSSIDGFSQKNIMINGNFDVWQRAFSQTTNGYGSSDRWNNINTGSTKVTSRQAFVLGQTTVPGSPEYYQRTVVTSVASAPNFVIQEQRIEDVNRTAGRTITTSFWAKADATKNVALEWLQSFGTGGSPSAIVTGIEVNNITLTSSWQFFTITSDIPSIAGKTLGTGNNDYLSLHMWLDAGSDWDSRTNSLGQQSGTFDFSRIQVEYGNTATDFEDRSYAEELLLCQRFYETSYDKNVLPGTINALGTAKDVGRSTGGNTYMIAQYKATKRGVATTIDYAVHAASTIGASLDQGGSVFVVGTKQNAADSDIYQYFAWYTGAVAGLGCFVHWTADAEL